jgi:hypothetical protein
MGVLATRCDSGVDSLNGRRRAAGGGDLVEARPSAEMHGHSTPAGETTERVSAGQRIKKRPQ